MKNVYKKLASLILINLIALSSFSQFNNAFRFKITGNGYSDETIIRLLNGASQNFDGSYDAWKLFSPNPSVPSIYTQVGPGQELSINSLPEFAEDKSITIYTNIPTNGTYTINVEEIYALTANYKISLTDISSNTHFRLLGDTALTFNFNTQQNSPSFTFNISTAPVSSTTDETCSAMNDGVLTIDNAGNTDWDIVITDAGNNVVLNSTSSTSISNFNNLSPGNYSAEVSSKGIVDYVNFSIAPAVSLTANFNLSQDTVYLSNGGLINISNNSQNAQNYSWDFDDGGTSSSANPTYAYTTVGTYDITLSASNANCVSTSSQQVTVLLSPAVITSVNDIASANVEIANLGNGKYQLTSEDYSSKLLSVYDISGQLILEDSYDQNTYSLSLTNSASGIYVLRIMSESGDMIQEKLYR